MAPPPTSAGISSQSVDLPSGRSIEYQGAEIGGELVTIRSPGGRVELEVLLTDAGPVLRFDAAHLELRAAGRIRAECARFEVVAANDIAQTAGGDLTTRARTTTITSTRGDVHLVANDDVKLTGERIKLNC
jgi:hypothetical protein